jgi:hypothetical protein
MVSCCTNIASPAKAPTVTPVIATKDQQESEPALTILIFPKMFFVLIYLVVTNFATTKEMIVWKVFLDFWIQGIDSPLQQTVFTVLIYPVLSDQMLRAAMAVLNKLVPKELLPILNISKISLSLIGCMYLESPSSRLPFGLNVPQLRTESFPQSKKCVIVVIVVQGRN